MTMPPMVGGMNDAAFVRECLVRTIKSCGLSRDQIADSMSALLGRTITRKMLDAFTSNRGDRRWPAEFDRAFCEATGDMALIEGRARAAGLNVISDEEMTILEFGRAALAQKRAAQAMAKLEADLAEVSL